MGKVKIRNYGGRSWISKYDDTGMTVHIANAEVESVEAKGSQLIIHINEKEKQGTQ